MLYITYTSRDEKKSLIHDLFESGLEFGVNDGECKILINKPGKKHEVSIKLYEKIKQNEVDWKEWSTLLEQKKSPIEDDPHDGCNPEKCYVNSRCICTKRVKSIKQVRVNI